ncbi:MAG: PHP domain-containing protein [Clostridia bacterium]|nr:PHP domain-containing protein [Clostridia bacterium]MBO5126624.1 PHP domain-containing protein [Clostridia bacterium]MBP3294078.1 PHP domain-containing protein [Clostridia bacterium]
MVKDYHIHAQVLTNPANAEAFLHAAIERGIDEICITDHMPLIGNSAGDRIPAGQVGRYCETVRHLAEQYRDRLSVKLGIEIDYHPSLEPQIHAVLAAGDFDYVLGSSHLHVLEGTFERYTTRNEYAAAMLENTCAAAESGLFDTIAHVDMYRWIFASPQRFPLADDGFCEERHRPLIDKTLETLYNTGVKLEINPHFAESCGENPDAVYPGIGITEAAIRRGVFFAYGSDAHKPASVGVMLPALRSHPLYGQALRIWEEEK